MHRRRLYSLQVINWVYRLQVIGLAAVVLLSACKEEKPAPPLATPTPTVAPTPAPTPSATPKPSPTPRKPSEDDGGVIVGASQYAFQETRWKKAEIRAINAIALDKASATYLRNEARYTDLATKSGVPQSIIFVLHGRESSWDFTKHLHNGDSLQKRTWQVPAGRPPTGNPPFTFEESALDALAYDHMAGPQWKKLGDGLQKLEAFNGLGYQKYHKDTPSPYLWAGTNIYSQGKYVADGKWSATAVDKQLGVACIMRWMIVNKKIRVWPYVE